LYFSICIWHHYSTIVVSDVAYFLDHSIQKNYPVRIAIRKRYLLYNHEWFMNTAWPYLRCFTTTLVSRDWKTIWHTNWSAHSTCCYYLSTTCIIQ